MAHRCTRNAHRCMGRAQAGSFPHPSYITPTSLLHPSYIPSTSLLHPSHPPTMGGPCDISPPLEAHLTPAPRGRPM